MAFICKSWHTSFRCRQNFTTHRVKPKRKFVQGSRLFHFRGFQPLNRFFTSRQDVLLRPPLRSPFLDWRPQPRRPPQLPGKEVDDVDEGAKDTYLAAHDHRVVGLRHQVQGRRRHGRRYARQLWFSRQIRRLGASHQGECVVCLGSTDALTICIRKTYVNPLPGE